FCHHDSPPPALVPGALAGLAGAAAVCGGARRGAVDPHDRRRHFSGLDHAAGAAGRGPALARRQRAAAVAAAPRPRSGSEQTAINMAPTLFTSCNALPPEGANFPWGGPAENCLAFLGLGCPALLNKRKVPLP